MNYRICVCDDENTTREYISTLVREWGEKQGIKLDIKKFNSSEEFLFHYEEDKNYDILLLDIEMKDMNGVELAKNIRMKNKEVIIIFISGYMEYITDGYDVEALHYLLKPIHVSKLYEILDKAKEKIKVNEKVIFIDSLEGTVRVPMNEIRFIEVRLNYLTIHGDEMYLIKKTLSSMEKELDERFVRSYRSYVVNLNYVRKIMKNEVILDDGTSIPLSKGYYDSVNQAFITYF